MAITAEFTADFAQWNESFKAATANLDDLAKQTEAFSQERLMKSAEATGAALREFSKEVIKVGQEYVTAYAGEQEATIRLEAALKDQGLASTEVIKNYEAMAKQFQQTTKYSDDSIIKAQTLFATIGKVGPEQMKAALDAATQLASGLSKPGLPYSLESSALLVAKAFATNGEHLGKLGKILGDTAPKGTEMAGVLEAIASKFGAQPAADLETFNGLMQQLGNQSDDAKEAVGGLMVSGLQPMLQAFLALPAPMKETILLSGTVGSTIFELAGKFAPIVTAVGTLIPYLTGAGGLVGAFSQLTAMLGPLVPYLGVAGIIAAGIGAWIYVLKNADVYVWALTTAWDALKAGVSSAIDAITAKFSAIPDGIRNIVGGFKDMYDRVVGHSYMVDMVDGIEAQIARLDSVMVAPAQAAADATAAALQTATDAVSSLMDIAGVPGAGGGGAPAGAGRGTLTLPLDKRFRQVMDAFGNVSVVMADTGEFVQRLEKKYGAGGFLGYGPAAGAGPTVPNVTVNVQGSVLSTREQLASLVGDALTYSYAAGGSRLPV